MWTDGQKLRIIINSLLDNAVKFTPTGSVTFKAEYENSTLSIEIIDTGIGISKEYSDRIFEDFYQQDAGYSRKYGGNGIGLSICKSYLNLLNGTITVQSEPDKGASFVIVITGFPGKR